MKALTFQAVGQVQFEAIPDPSIESPGDAIVEVVHTAICGSDLHVYQGREVGIDVGTVMGHEFCGRIVACGRDVKQLSVGDRVVSPFTTHCGGCFYCKRGLSCRCVRGNLYGWRENGVGLHGAQASLVRVPMADSTLMTLPAVMDLELGLFLGDILATGYYAAQQANIEKGDSVAVVGCGPVGLLAALSALHLGAGRVFALDSVEERLDLAASIGASPINIRTVSALEAIRDATEGRGVDAVLEAVGSPQATRSAFELIRPGGTISAVGVHTEAHLSFSPGEAYDKNLSYRAGRCPAGSLMPSLIPLALKHEAFIKGLVSHRLPLSEGVHGYHIFANKLDACTKVFLQPD